MKKFASTSYTRFHLNSLIYTYVRGGDDETSNFTLNMVQEDENLDQFGGTKK